MWEILDIRDLLLDQLIRQFTEQGEQEKAKNLAPMYRENREWKQVLERVYEEFHVPKETFEFCYLYVVKGVSCINDVIRIRREMLGLSREELCKGICSPTTLRRLEARRTTPHRDITAELFERLGLSREFTRTNLVTASQEAKILMRRLQKQNNEENWNASTQLQEQLKDFVTLDSPFNRQVLKQQEALAGWKKKELTDKEYRGQMLAALELTLPYEAFRKEGEKYLTCEEQVCLQNLMQEMSDNGEEYQICALRLETMCQAFLEKELQDAMSRVYEFNMMNIASRKGNQGKFQVSDRYILHIIIGCLRLRRLAMLHKSLYSRWWNYAEQKSRGIPTATALNDAEELTQCILLSRLNKQKNHEQFYVTKLSGLNQRKSSVNQESHLQEKNHPEA